MVTVMANLRNIVEEYFGLIEDHNTEEIRDLMHRNYSYTGTEGQERKGVDVGIEVMEMYTKAFPDLKIEIKNIHVAGDTVITEFVANGTHRGELLGVPPTGKIVRVPICNVIEFRDDKIYAEREYFDTVVLLQQLGVDVQKQIAAV